MEKIMNIDKLFAIKGADCIISPEDLGLVNTRMSMNGYFTDVAAIRGMYAPPMFSDDFRFYLRFNEKSMKAVDYKWSPVCLTRKGRAGNWSCVSNFYLVSGTRSAVMKLEVTNTSASDAALQLQCELIGGLGRPEHWGFGKPLHAPFTTQSFDRGIFMLDSESDRIAFASSLKITPKLPLCSGVLDAASLSFKGKEKKTFYFAFAMDEKANASKLVKTAIADPEKMIRETKAWWNKRTEKLFSQMPVFASDNDAYTKVYNRSMLHLLLNEWDVPEFLHHPYYSTGSVNGGCVCCYLWNYGEPYRLWSMLNPQAAKEHLKTYLKLDLSSCFAFFPEDGSAYGPYYPINQEKTIFLTHAYVLQTGDKDFLFEELNGKPIIEHMIEQAVMHDDFSKDAVLVDYGDGNHHLELRRELRYDGIVPDLNLRRCVNYYLVDELCKIANVKTPVDFAARARALKKAIHDELFDAKEGWFYAIDMKGEKYFRYTMQMFKALGWGDMALTEESENALIKHLMDPAEFRGEYGIHSLGKQDPAYDERDIDNGGPGCCISFAPAIVDRLYKSGKSKEAETIFNSLLWLGSMLPYWGDSQRADVPEYRRDTPLQNDIQGAALAQSIIFGMFGIRCRIDGTVEVKPALPEKCSFIELKNVRLAGKVFDIYADKKCGVSVKCACGKTFSAKHGEAVIF